MALYWNCFLLIHTVFFCYIMQFQKVLFVGIMEIVPSFFGYKIYLRLKIRQHLIMDCVEIENRHRVSWNVFLAFMGYIKSKAKRPDPRWSFLAGEIFLLKIHMNFGTRKPISIVSIWYLKLWSPHGIFNNPNFSIIIERKFIILHSMNELIMKSVWWM